MRTSSKGIELIKSFEGCRLTAYKDAIGIPTIGYGHTKGVKLGQVITQAQATEFLKQDLTTSEKAVASFDSLYHWTQGEFDALVSFTFNCGTGNLKKLVANGSRTKAQISDAILLYDKAGGKALAGLTRRRKAERALFGNEAKATPTIRSGSRGDAVKTAQTLLTSAGYSVGTIDGIFGAKTDRATRKFQQDNGLVVDGIIGAKTWQKLKSR